uniref:(northern house mosquito) hypothetical protein n=1 Tax=Culex pipiens TaxID=7175 RepID=A0A8D8NH67_CULPI
METKPTPTSRAATPDAARIDCATLATRTPCRMSTVRPARRLPTTTRRRKRTMTTVRPTRTTITTRKRNSKTRNSSRSTTSRRTTHRTILTSRRLPRHDRPVSSAQAAIGARPVPSRINPTNRPHRRSTLPANVATSDLARTKSTSSFRRS